MIVSPDQGLSSGLRIPFLGARVWRPTMCEGIFGPVYATCMFCNGPLGRNEALEAFPVGRGLAYDASRGRLWVICPRCGRWNLTPLEERWEAIEQAEYLYRGTRLRAATEHVGLARVADGTHLVRIGRPLRPEFAAWRYGDRFGRRRRRQVVLDGGGLAAYGGIAAAALGTGIVGQAVGAGFLGLVGLYWGASKAYQVTMRRDPHAVVARWRDDGGALLKVRRLHLTSARLELGPGSVGAVLRVPHEAGEHTFTGAALLRAAAHLLPAVNLYGGSRTQVAEAVQHLEREDGPEGLGRVCKAGHSASAR